MTNTTKAQIIVAVNAILALVVAFGVNLSDGQTSAIIVATNAVLSLWVGLTYQNSPKRKDDAATADPPPKKK